MMQQTFIPSDLDCGDFEQLEPLFQKLLERSIASPEAARQWLADFSELSAAVSEYGSRRNIEHTCHTDDPDIEKAFLHFVENVSPKIKPYAFKLQKKLLDSGYADQLDAGRFDVMVREWQAEVELYREENIPLQTEVTKTVSEYDKLCGAMLVEFRGKQYTLQQLARFLEEPDRDTRREAWTLAANRRLEDREKIDEIFDKLLDLRAKIAANADLDNYRDYTWKACGRFDYTPQDCHDFAEAVEKTCLPAVKKMNRERKQLLGVDALRPWDLSVDVQNREPLRPFDPDNVDEMVSKVGEIFEQMSPVFGEQYRTLKPGRNLDLESRRGKRPGGYQSSLEQVREPFIFMNAAGLHRDVETMLHEGGHAFHYMAARDEPIVFVRHAPLEFCEVASMSMELLALDRMGVFYGDEGVARAAREQFEGVIRKLVWIATIDQFQHWLYTHDGHTAEQRTNAWLDIHGRFTDDTVDYTGFEPNRAALWQRQLHLFHYPFYYIEYGIAQLGALQVWMNYRRDGEQALRQLREAFALGNTKPLPQLFETAGIRFDFSSDTIGPLIEQVSGELEALPA